MGVENPKIEVLEAKKEEIIFNENDAVKIVGDGKFGGVIGNVSRVIENGEIIEVLLRGHKYEGMLEKFRRNQLEKIEGYLNEENGE